MNDMYDTGCVVNEFIYIMEWLVTIAAYLIFNEVNPVLLTIFVAYFVVSAYDLYQESFAKLVRGKYIGRNYLWSFLVMSFVMSYVFQSPHLFFVVLFIASMSLLFFMKLKLCYLEMKVTLVVLFVMGIIEFPWLKHHYDGIEYLVSACALLMVQSIGMFLVKNLVFQNRQNREQERSLDDMLKVVEVKCEEAKRATRSKSDFLSNMSHEIRTPINAVLGMNEMILRESKDEAILKYAANVENSGKMLLSLINDVLDFSKIESGRMEIIPVEYQFCSVLNDLVNMIKSRAEQKGLVLKLEINESIPNELFGDEVRIRQIVTNMLTNAVKYTDTGSVTLIADFKKTEENKGELYFGIKDTGRGIKPEDKEKLFQSFQRVDEKNNRSIEGTGLGLSITKCFVDMMNGRIGVDSVYGEGSLFYVYIPQTIVKDEPVGDFNKQFEASLKNREHYRRSFTAPDAHILVVDDNKMNLAVVQGLLKQTQVQLDSVESGMQCLDLLRKQNYDLILLDHMMPVMDGVETLKHMKKEKLAEGIPVIALTANAVSGAREMYLEYGFQDYLSKPIAGNALEKMLYRWLPSELIREDTAEDETDISASEEVEQNKENSLEEAETGQSGENAGIIWPEEMDLDTAMQYSFMGEQGILFTVGLYLENVEKTRSSLSECFARRDYKNYAVHAHSLKSTSATIGLLELSELAKKMEFAGKAEDGAVIEEHHQELLDMYADVVEKLKTLPKMEM